MDNFGLSSILIPSLCRRIRIAIFSGNSLCGTLLRNTTESNESLDAGVVLVGVKLVDKIEAHGGGLARVRLLAPLLQLLEELGGRVRARRPQDAQAREVDGQQLQARSHVARGDVLRGRRDKTFELTISIPGPSSAGNKVPFPCE